jgi:hypothetical protein
VSLQNRETGLSRALYFDPIRQLHWGTAKDLAEFRRSMQTRSKLTGYSKEKQNPKIPLTPFVKGGIQMVTCKKGLSKSSND